MAKVSFLIGEPGIGKSTLLGAALEHLERYEIDHLEAGGPARELLHDGHGNIVGCELGRRAGKHPEGYPGTDAMSMSAITATERWLLDGADGLGLVALEGTRLANKRFVEACQNGGHDLTVYYLYGPPIARQRREERGSQQNPQWLKGRQTAANNFYQLVDRMTFEGRPHVYTHLIPAARPLDDSVRYLRTLSGLALPVS
jgi:hypothetical protein